MRWSQATCDLAGGRTWRTDHDLDHLQRSLQFQLDRGEPDAPYVQHGTGPDQSLVELAKAFDKARLAGGHGAPSYTDLGWVDPATLEHPDERTDQHSHNWGAGRAYKPGDPTPAPILSSLPVRSRSARRWDGDGM
jgi:hypothetical protein